MTVHPAGAEGIAWIEQRAPCVLTRDAVVIEARDRDGLIVGAVAFDGWTPSSAQMHVAIDRPMAVRKLRPDVFGWVFGEMPGGVARQIAFGVVRASNHRALLFDTKLGFRVAARLRDGWAMGEDMVLLELRKEDYRG